jgi:tape measure domain-containing protein
MADSSEFRIVVKVDPAEAKAGLGQVKTELDEVGNALTAIGESVGLYELAHQALDLVESYEKVQNRLRNLTSSEEDLRSVTASLFQVAEQSRGSFNATADVYAKLARANQEVGFSQAQLLQVTKALNQEAVIQGRTSEDLTGIVGQLSIALQTGTLNARALRLIFRDFPDLASALETQLGATSREFKNLGQEGKISGEAIFNALLAASDGINDKFGKTIVTLDSAMTNLRNNFQQFVSSANESTGATHAAAEGIQFLADHVNALGGALAALGVLLSGEVLVRFGALASKATALTEGFQLMGAAGAAALGPLVVIGAAAGSIGVTIGKAADDVRALNEETTGANPSLTAYGQSMGFLETKIKALRAVLAANPDDQRALTLLEGYTSELGKVKDQYTQVSDAKKKSAALDQLVVNETRNLEEQVRILQLGNKEREVQTKLLETTQKLQASGITLTSDQKDELAGRLRNIQALTDSAKVLTDLRGPQEEYARRVQLATELLVAGTLTVEEYNRVLRSGGLTGELENLQRETDLLKFNAQQREIVLELRKAEEIEGRKLSGNEALAIVQAIQTRQALSEQAKVLEEINGPQEAYARRVEALTKLLEQGKISAFEYNQALSSKTPLGPAVPPELDRKFELGAQNERPTAGPLAETLAKMGEENDLLVLNNEQRTLAITLMQAQNSVGRTLTTDEIKQLTDLTAQHQELTDQLQGEERARAAVLSLQQEVLNNLQGPQEHLAGVQTQLNVLFNQGKISAEEFSRGLLQVDLAARQTDTSLEGGLARGFDKIKLQLNDVATTAENALVGAFNSANNALTQFVQTGKLNFASLASSILGDIAKIALQMAESQLFSGGGAGGGGGLLAGLFGGGGGAANFGLSSSQIAGGFFFAEGGDYSGKHPFIAGENGPEVVDPGGQGGRVIPSDQTRRLLGGGQAPVNVAPPQVHVHITNVDDPNKTSKALSTREGEKAIMNIISRNKEAVKRSLQ